MLSVASGAFSFLNMGLISAHSLLISTGEAYRKDTSVNCSGTFVSPLGQGKMARDLRLRKALSKLNVVLDLGAEAPHSTRNGIWIMLKMSLWLPIPFRAEGKTQGV